MTKQSIQVKLEDKLRSMKGKTFLYNTMTVQILSWKYDGEYCTVVTSAPWITQPTHEMLKKLNEEFLEAEEDGVTPSEELATSQPPAYQAVPMPKLKALEKCDDLVDLLFDNIAKVTQSKEHVDQARAVADLSKTVTGIAKVQLEAIRLANELNNR